MQDSFTYDRIVAVGRVEDSRFHSYVSMHTEDDDFIVFQDEKVVDQKTAAGVPDVGWKLHVKVDDQVPDNLARAWDIVCPILRRNHVAMAKVININTWHMTGNPDAQGRQMTIYSNLQPDLNWQRISTVIERALTRADIVPDVQHSSNQDITGSQYLSYRCDGFETEDDTEYSARKDVIISEGNQQRYSVYFMATPERTYDLEGRAGVDPPNPYVDITVNYDAVVQNPLHEPAVRTQNPVYAPAQGEHNPLYIALSDRQQRVVDAARDVRVAQHLEDAAEDAADDAGPAGPSHVQSNARQ